MQKLPKSQRSSARRVDVRVRAANPHVQTEIHEIDQQHHVIFAPAEQLSEAEYKDEFDNRVTPVAMQIEFSNDRPQSSEILSAISDGDLAYDFEGMIVTGNDFNMALQAIFPDAPSLSGSQIRDDGVLEFYFDTELPEPLREKIYNFLDRHIDLRKIEVLIRPPKKVGQTNRSHSDDLITFRPVRQRGNLPKFVLEEEEWWFAKLDDVFRGNISKETLLSSKFTGAACYIDGLMQGIDIRQALLAFDTIYLHPPIEDPPNNPAMFSDSLNISKEEVLYLIERDRVRLVLSQPEERCDIRLLEAALERNPQGVLGRRKTAAMVISDIVETDDSYLFSRPDLGGQVREVISRLANEIGATQSVISRSVLFPKFARRSWVSSFQDLGALGIEPYGQGNLFAEAWKAANSDKEQDPRLEADLFGHSVHMAHALEATYLPHGDGNDYVNSWITPMRLMGDRLNFYRAFNDKTAAVWAQNERLKIDNKLELLPPIPLFDFNCHAPIRDIDAITSTSSRIKGRSLIGQLADLPIEERGAEIQRLQRELYEFQGRKDRQRDRQTLLEVGVDIGVAALGYSLGPFMSGLQILSRVAEAAKRSPTLDLLISEIEGSLTPKHGLNDDLKFLDKVSRVAEIKSKE